MSPPPQVLQAPTAGPAARVGFWRAAAAPWSGLGFLVSQPRAWPLAAVPLLVASLLIGGLSWLSITELPGLVGQLLPEGTQWYLTGLRAVVQILAVVTAVVLACLVGALLSQPLSGPALERLVRLREQQLGLRERAPTSLLTDVSRSARGALIGLLALPVLGALTLVELAVPGSTVVVLPLKLLVTGAFVSWDLLDYPLSVRDMGMRARLAWIRAHTAEVLGFGLSLACVFLLPCAQLLLLPAGVVGATTLVARIEEQEAAAGEALGGPETR
jgi:CysZ protein